MIRIIDLLLANKVVSSILSLQSSRVLLNSPRKKCTDGAMESILV